MFGFLANPVFLKEIRGRMRGIRAIVPSMVYLGALTFMLFLTWGGERGGAGTGREIVGALITSQIVLIIIMTPAFTASALSNEREKGTYGLMLTTLISPAQIVLGKLLVAFSYSAVLVLTALPALALGILLGGIDIQTILLNSLQLITISLMCGSVGMFMSTFSSKNHQAVGWSYTFCILATLIFFLLPKFISFIITLTAPAGASLPLALQLPLTLLFGISPAGSYSLGFAPDPYDLLSTQGRHSMDLASSLLKGWRIHPVYLAVICQALIGVMFSVLGVITLKRTQKRERASWGA